jgi:hypothetical protein
MERASEHAEDLKTEIASFLASEPYKLLHEFDAERFPDVPPGATRRRGVHLYRVDAEPVPDRIAILAGDVLKDLRSSLDYVAWQLALARSDTPPPTTAFPIFIDEKRYQRDKLRFVGGIDPSIYPEFDAVQPYHAGDDAANHPLWVLHRMANDDKHKVPHIVGSLPTGIGVNRPDESVDFSASIRVGPFGADDVVAELVVTKGARPETELEMFATFDLAFSKDAPTLGPSVFPEINRIGIEVERVLTRFRQYF